MKTIQVIDEVYNILLSISKDMSAQDNRATADPYYYQIIKYKYVPTDWGHADKVEFFDGCDTLVDASENGVKELYVMYDENPKILEIIPLLEDIHMNEYDINEILGLMTATPQWRLAYSKKVRILENVFFTENGINKHLSENAHRYPEGTTNYVEHAFRNPEMDAVVKLLRSIATQQDKKKYEIKNIVDAFNAKDFVLMYETIEAIHASGTSYSRGGNVWAQLLDYLESHENFPGSAKTTYEIITKTWETIKFGFKIKTITQNIEG